MEVSNKTLAMFLVAAIVVSIAGTMISLNRLEQTRFFPTGMATNDTGNVTVSIGETLSISIDSSSTIAFICNPSSTAHELVNSEVAGWGGDVCEGAGLARPTGGFIIINDGNIPANVSLNVSDTGQAHNTGTFLTSPTSNSWIAYRTDDEAGCVAESGPASYTNLTSTAAMYSVCGNLQPPQPADNNVRVHVAFLLPQGAPEQDTNVEFLFWAKKILP